MRLIYCFIVIACTALAADSETTNWSLTLENAAKWGAPEGITRIKKMIATGEYTDHLNRALGVAARWSSLEMVKVLVEAGADARAVGLFGVAERFNESATNSFEIAKYLVEHGAKIDVAVSKTAQYPYKVTPLYYACGNSEELALYLLEQGANPNGANDGDQKALAPIYNAANRGKPNLVKELLKRGVDPNVSDPATGRTPLHRVVLYDFEAAKSLIEAGADVNAVANDYAKSTVLHCAVDAFSNKVAQLDALVAAGADVMKTDKRGRTPLQYARKMLRYCEKSHLRGVEFRGGIEFQRREYGGTIGRLEEYEELAKAGKSPAELARKYLKEDEAATKAEKIKPAAKSKTAKQKSGDSAQAATQSQPQEAAESPAGNHRLLWLFAAAIAVIGIGALLLRRKR